MGQTDEFLVELGTEELPPKALIKLRDAFCDGIRSGLESQGLSFDQVNAYATPRRLSVLVSTLQTRQEDKVIERKGPSVTAAFDADGNPTSAALGFAASCKTTIDQVSRLKNDKGEWLFYEMTQPGQDVVQLLPGIVSQSLDKLPIPKRMRWGDKSVEFVRPVHWLVMMLGKQVIEAEILGIKSANISYGHRFHFNEPIVIEHPSQYIDKLLDPGHVIVNVDERRSKIKEQVINCANVLGGTAIISPDLLDEVTSLVEWPVAVSGDFENRFLEVPQEALISSMQDHQRYFPVVDNNDKLMPYFITVANIVSKKPSSIKAGNERVIRPRLADAAFFFEQDKKLKLASHTESLKQVVFQKKLGTIYDKVARFSALAINIGSSLGLDIENIERAALLCKCDLMTTMVGEFPELQGIMGRHYAVHDGEHPDVAIAIDEHYRPRNAGDGLPANQLASVLSIADKLDTIAGIFAIGSLPTGDKDPYGLRRAALGIIRIMLEQKIDLDIVSLIDSAVDQIPFDIDKSELTHQIRQFVFERLRHFYAERGVSSNLFDAVNSCRPTRLTDFDQRIHACAVFANMEEAESLSAANKRVRNILKKVDEPLEGIVNQDLLKETAEVSLYKSLTTAIEKVEPLISQRDYTRSLQELAALKVDVDQFFDSVMVMCDDRVIQKNRLTLLKTMSDQFMQIADISRL